VMGLGNQAHYSFLMKHTDETKRKISEAHKGVAKSYEHRRKLSEASKGNQSHAKQLSLFPSYYYKRGE
jgi:hypothetical protein